MNFYVQENLLYVYYETHSPNLDKLSKIRGRRQVPECKHSLKEGLFWMIRRENDG